MRIERLKEIVLGLIAFILIVFLIKYLNIFKYLKMLLTILIPLFICFIYAWIFNPLIRKISKKYNRNIVSIVVFLVFIACFGLFIYFLIPTFYKEIMEFIQYLPNIFKTLELKIDNMGFNNYLDRILEFLVQNIPKILISFIGNVFKYIGVVVIGFIIGLYISIDYEKIIKGFFEIIPTKYKCVVVSLVQEMSGVVRKCVNGTLLIASAVFLMDSLCFLFIGLDSPFLLGMLCGITDLIPYVGPYIGGVVAVLVGFTESKILGILTIITCVVVQSIENYILQPLVMSKSIKISPILIIVGLLVFGKFFGVFGMIFATPIIAMLKVLFNKLMIVLKKCNDRIT